MLKRQIEGETRESISLKNNIIIEVHTASFRTTRGYSIVAALLDEIAYWPVDENASSPDVEVINAIKPSMATIPNSMLLCASSPYSRRGALWDAHRKHHGKDGDPVLVWQAPTRAMNSSVPQSFIDNHMQEDPARAAAEYMAEFRSDLEDFVSREAVEACVDWGVFERPCQSGIGYIAGIDPAGGSGRDAMTLCIGHLDYTNSGIVIDCLREHRPPFSPEIVASEFSAVIKSYHSSTAFSDRWGGDWVKEQFRKFGVTCEPAPKVKNQLYIDLLPTVNSKRIRLLDHTRCINQLIGLERSTGRSEIIDHAPGQSDDLINSVALVASLAISRATFNIYDPFGVGPDQDDPATIKQRQQDESDSNFRWRLGNYMRAVGIPYGGWR